MERSDSSFKPLVGEPHMAYEMAHAEKPFQDEIHEIESRIRDNSWRVGPFKLGFLEVEERFIPRRPIEAFQLRTERISSLDMLSWMASKAVESALVQAKQNDQVPDDPESNITKLPMSEAG